MLYKEPACTISSAHGVFVLINSGGNSGTIDSSMQWSSIHPIPVFDRDFIFSSSPLYGTGWATRPAFAVTASGSASVCGDTTDLRFLQRPAL